MRSFFTLLLVAGFVLPVAAQWSNTTNTFTNDLHMPVSTAAGIQNNSLVINSYPDGGYFVIWEDRRNGFSAPKQVFAQKYDGAGNRLWAANGVAVSASTNGQQFTFSANQDYRNRHVAASDNAGGLYITYTDDSSTNYLLKRICVQHLKSNATLVFPGVGHIIAQTPPGQTYNYAAPQLIGDDDGGFYLAYINTNNLANDYVHVYNYRDEGGVLKLYGGGVVNQNILSQLTGNPCGGPKYDLLYPGTTVIDYNIWPDLQGNCNVVLSMNGNNGTQGNMLCYNKVWKAKKEETVTVARFLADRSARTDTIVYHKGDADVLYKARFDGYTNQCQMGQNTYVWTDYMVASQGYRALDVGAYPYYAVKGATLTTGGNINAALVTCTRKTITGNTVSDPCLFAVGFTDEIYNAVPYPRASNGNPLIGENTQAPAGLNTLTYFRDTLLPTGVFEYDFSLAAGSNHAYLAALILEKQADNAAHVRLQHLTTESIGTGQYQFKYETGSKQGALIGSELNTGFGSTAIDYDFPLLTANTTGNALLTINEAGRYTRVSPIFNGASLAWGAMGKPIGAPQVNGFFINTTAPFVALDAADGTGVISWFDQRNFATTDQDIYMRHLDNLNAVAYTPPNKKVVPLPGGSLLANPAVLTGVSKKYSIIEAFNATTGALSPVVELLDNYDLGAVPVGVYENTGAVRTVNGKPYLDRNYTITPQNNPNGAANINVRLYFTTAAFDALKLADPTITNPGSLAVIKQPNASGTVPSSFVLSGAETELMPVSWQAVDGGYYLEVVVNGFSNFFVQKAAAALPLTWLGVQAQWTGDHLAAVSWQVADQQNVKDYIVQQSADGIVFADKCNVAATAATSYSCAVPAGNGLNYFRVLQRDLDNRVSYSKTVTLKTTAGISLAVRPNPVQRQLSVTVPTGYRLLQVTDVQGKLVLQQAVVAGVHTLEVSNLRAGTYLLTGLGDGVRNTVRFIKE